MAQMLVDGAWTGAASGETFSAESPATGETIDEIPRAIARTPAGRSRRPTGRRTVGARDGVRAGRGDAPGRGRDRAASRRAGAHADARPGQAASAESYDEVDELVLYWRNAAEDGKRLEGRLANSFSPGNGRC